MCPRGRPRGQGRPRGLHLCNLQYCSLLYLLLLFLSSLASVSANSLIDQG